MNHRPTPPPHPSPAAPTDVPPFYDEELSLQELNALVRCVKTLSTLFAEAHRGVDSDRETMRSSITELRDVLRRMYYPDAATAVYDADGHLILPDAALLTPNRRYYASRAAKLETALEKMTQICRLNRPSDSGPSPDEAPDLLPETGKRRFCRDYATPILFGMPFVAPTKENGADFS